MTKRVVRIVVLLAIVSVVLLIAGGSYFLNVALTPEEVMEQKQPSSLDEMCETYPFLGHWVDSLEHHQLLKDTFIYNDKAVKLHGYYIEAAKPTSATAVIVHGYTDNAIRMFMIGYMYNHDLGYNVLLPDLQYHGKSDGDAIQMGWLDRLDVLKWMDVANAIFNNKSEMVVHGISMGAATTMMVSGEKLPSFVKCFVEDCGYTSVDDEFAYELKQRYNLPRFPLINVASALCEIKYGWSFSEASAIRQVAKCKRPMFFIHGGDDHYVPTSMVYDLYEAKPEPKLLWVVPGVKHALSYLEHKDEYTTKVKEFVGHYIQ